ncbi:MAG TPA: GYD domain-containing protein [Thermoplasmata archaeon]|nr:GYD domain-containing protein [Thermoplasmata archaeon]
MPRYIRLVRFTEQAVKNVARLTDLLADARKVFEANGGKVVDAYATLGRYDLIAIVEAPDDATMMKISALVARQVSVHAETLPAVPAGDFAKSVAAAK